MGKIDSENEKSKNMSHDGQKKRSDDTDYSPAPKKSKFEKPHSKEKLSSFDNSSVNNNTPSRRRLQNNQIQKNATESKRVLKKSMNESSDDSSDDGVNVNITRGENSQHGRASRQNAMDSESFDDHVKTLRSKNERTSSNESEYGSVYVRRQLCKRKINDFDSKTSSASGTKDFDDKTSLASKDDVSLPNKIFKLSNQFLTESLRRISEICVLMQKYMSFLGNMKNIGDWLSKYNNKFKQLIGKEVNSDEENRMETESLNECSVEGNKDDGEVQQNLETDLEDENKSEGKNNKKVKKEKKLNKDDSLNEEEKIVEMTNENVNNKKQNEVDEKLSTMDQLCDKGYGSGESKANDEPMDEDTDNENCISLLEHQFSDSSNSSSRKPSIKFDNLIFTPDGTHENLPTDDEEQINKNKPQSSNKSSMNLDNDIVYYLDKSGKLRQHIEDNINQKKSVTKAIFSSQEQNIRSSSCEIVSVVENVSDSGEKFLNQWNKVGRRFKKERKKDKKIEPEVIIID